MMVALAVGTSEGDQDEETLRTFFRDNLIAVIKWGAYAIALGVLILLGIKYVISPANDRANVKGKLVIYMIGMFLIALSTRLASLVAEIAGNNNTRTDVDTAIQLAGGNTIGYTNYGKPQTPKPTSYDCEVDAMPAGFGGIVEYYDEETKSWVVFGNLEERFDNLIQLPPGTKIRITLNDTYNDQYILDGWDLGNGEYVYDENGVIEFVLEDDMHIAAHFDEVKPITGVTVAVGDHAGDEVPIPDNSTFSTVLTVDPNTIGSEHLANVYEVDFDFMGDTNAGNAPDDATSNIHHVSNHENSSGKETESIYYYTDQHKGKGNYDFYLTSYTSDYHPKIGTVSLLRTGQNGQETVEVDAYYRTRTNWEGDKNWYYRVDPVTMEETQISADTYRSELSRIHENHGMAYIYTEWENSRGYLDYTTGNFSRIL